MAAEKVENVQALLKTTWKDHFRPPAGPTRIAAVSFSDATMHVDLTDGRRVSVPLAWFPVLERATPEQRSRYKLVAEGRAVSWEELDEDLSLEGFLQLF